MTYPAPPANSRYGPGPNNHPDQKELSNIIRNMDEGASGSNGTSIGPAPLVMGMDGVLRTLTPDCDVIDAIGLTPRLIKAFLDQTTFDQEIEDMFWVSHSGSWRGRGTEEHAGEVIQASTLVE